MPDVAMGRLLTGLIIIDEQGTALQKAMAKRDNDVLRYSDLTNLWPSQPGVIPLSDAAEWKPAVIRVDCHITATGLDG